MTDFHGRSIPLTHDSRSVADPIAGDSASLLRMGLVGLGGYAGYICDYLCRVTDEKSPLIRMQLTAVCDPALDQHAARVAMLRERGVAVFSKYEDLLHEAVDAVWLPLPIHLHRPFTELAMEAGKAVLCEKPAAGTVQEVDEMIAARERYRKPVAVGFQQMYDPGILQLKRRLLAGGIGKIESAAVMGCWPRDSGYFSRNGWVGKMRFEDAWVLDSPLANAMSHYLQLALFLLGPREGETANAVKLEVELYRANAIENFDTCSLRITTDTGAKLLVLLTHACFRNIEPQVDIVGESGRARVHPELRIELHGSGERADESSIIPLSPNPRDQMLASFCPWVRGGEPAGAVATLQVARAPVLVVNAASEAAPVHTIDPGFVRTIPTTGNRTIRAVTGIEAILESCMREGKMIHESGLAAWSSPGGTKSTAGYRAFTAPFGRGAASAGKTK